MIPKLLTALGIMGWLALAIRVTGEESPPEILGEKTEWILIPSRPRPWASPGGARMEKPLRVNAGQVVWADQTRKVEDSSWFRIRLGDQQCWLPEPFLAPRPRTVSPAELGRIGTESVDRFNGLSPDYMPPDLVKISHGYDDAIQYRLRKEAAAAYESLIAAAARDSVDLMAVSAYRSYDTQRELYLFKLRTAGWKQTTVAKPGHSEHQLGVAVDFTDGNLERLLRPEFGAGKAGKWLARRAPEFGFAVSYTEANSAQTGYAPEPWHYRYFGVPEAAARHDSALRGKPPAAR